MNEDDLEALNWKPYTLADGLRVEGQWGRAAILEKALFGVGTAYLERQLLAQHPEIPEGFELADYRMLVQFSRQLVVAARNPRFQWLNRSSFLAAPYVQAGTKRINLWEARYEVARRALEYLEGR